MGPPPEIGAAAGPARAHRAGLRRRARQQRVVAKRLRLSPTTVGKWRARFRVRSAGRAADEPRPGAPRTVTDDQVERRHHPHAGDQAARRHALEHPRHGQGRAGSSQTIVARIWRAFGLQPHRAETFKLSTDPLFVEKVRDIVGLYLNPPDRAIVLCVDEKSQIQALDRTQPLLPMRPGRPSGAPTTTSATARRRCSPRWTSPPAR